MKSLSLDSPECGELRRRPPRDHPPAQGSRVLCTNSTPSSPVHSRRLLSARGGRMSSVELPDEPDKSLSSNSASPCPSPVKQPSKHQRLLPTNLYVILYNFKSRHADELDLKAGYKVTVIDTSDPDWWKGKCLGKIGYFPSKYCTKLQAGERPLQVTHNLQVSDGDNGLMLLRDQIVIQVGDEVDGMVMIRSGDNRQGVCPVKFLQEKRGSLTDDKIRHYEPKTIRSAPVTPCDSDNSTWSDRWIRKNHDHYSGYDKPYDSYIGNEGTSAYDKASYEESVEGVWWWRRPLGVRRTHCRRCGASSSSRPLRMSPCAGMSQDEDGAERRPIMSRDRPLNFVRQLFL
ncbi:hypothetical protein O3G_MSEX004424 [Manduca sexta]|uniref:SH3 domain-containing protein n=1 Tax=Manduca sexta TaxID=7130 RepID=A0A922CGX8_MANSE|nr:hypothetical protein O3G_MSEX004424 [Manduca sexta]